MCTPLHTDRKLNLLMVGFQGTIFAVSIIVAFVVSKFILGYPNIPLFISLWLFCASIGALFYLENYIINSFIASSIIPMAMVVLTNLDHYTFDYAHFFVMGVAILALILNKPISLIFLIAFSGIGVAWYAIVKPIIYPAMPTVLTFAAATIINAVVIILIIRRRSKV